MTDDPKLVKLAAAKKRMRKRPQSSATAQAYLDAGKHHGGHGRDDEAATLDCPVTALGHRHGVYYFLSSTGEIREVRPRDMNALVLLSLFGGDPAWLYQHYPKLDRKGLETGEIDATAAASALMRRCTESGLWRVDTPKRGVGVWRNAKGWIVAHCGDHLLFFEPEGLRRSAAGVRLDGEVYVASPAIAPPAGDSATREQAAWLLRQIERLWRFGGDHLPRLVFGFIATAMLGAAPSWRVHILLVGRRGCGKTTLLRLIRAALGSQANFTNDPTEAGLRELLSDEARSVVYDEAAGDGGEEKRTRIAAIIGLLRRMAGDEGAKSIRGTGAGAKQYTMAGSAALAAANAPTLDAQDRSRILDVDMLPADPSKKDAVEAAIAAAEAISGALRARALAGWPRFVDNLQVYRQALIKAQCDARQADQLGTLLAGAEMMFSDNPIDSDSAEAEIHRLAPIITAYRAEDEELANANRCLGTLMTTSIEHWRGSAKSTVGRLVQLARDPANSVERQALPVHGLRLERTLEGKLELWIANQHRGLEQIFEDTVWHSGGWRRALLQLPETIASENSMQFAGFKARFIVLPEQYLPVPEPPEKEAAPAPV